MIAWVLMELSHRVPNPLVPGHFFAATEDLDTIMSVQPTETGFAAIPVARLEEGDEVTGIAVNHNACQLWVALSSGRLLLLLPPSSGNTKNGLWTVREQFASDTQTLGKLALLPNGTLVAWNRDGQVTVWPDPLQRPRSFHQFRTTVRPCAFLQSCPPSCDRALVAVVSPAGIAVWDVASNPPVARHWQPFETPFLPRIEPDPDSAGFLVRSANDTPRLAVPFRWTPSLIA